MLRIPAASWLPLLLLVASSAGAQPADDAARSAARRLGDEGVELYQRGDYEAALDRLTRAEALIEAPSLALWAARCLVKLNRLVEANEHYLAASRVAVDEQDLDKARLQVQKDAQASAAREREQLLPRIPELTISLKGAEAGEVTLTLDGKPVPPVLVGVAQPVDPGKHEIVASYRGSEQRRQLTLAEGAKQSAELSFDRQPSEEPVPPAKPPPKPAPPPGDPKRDRSSGGFPLPAYVSFGVGAAGLVVGGIGALLAVQKKSDLDATCPDRQCPPSSYDDVDSYNSFRTISSVGFGIGLVGVAAGAVFLITAPGEPKVSARVGLGSVGVGGKF